MHVSVFVATVHVDKHQHTQRSDEQLNEIHSLSSVFKVYILQQWVMIDEFCHSLPIQTKRIEAFWMMDCISITSF